MIFSTAAYVGEGDTVRYNFNPTYFVFTVYEII
jgi:hypothetical protein